MHADLNQALEFEVDRLTTQLTASKAECARLRGEIRSFCEWVDSEFSGEDSSLAGDIEHGRDIIDATLTALRNRLAARDKTIADLNASAEFSRALLDQAAKDYDELLDDKRAGGRERDMMIINKW